MSPRVSYTPNDAGLSVALLQSLREHPDLLAAAADTPPVPAAIERLRRRWPPELVRAALVLAEVRRKAPTKFGTASVWSPPEALEQATSLAVARHKAARMATIHPTRIDDYCAGIGGDAIAFAEVAPVIAVDLSPVRLWCLNQNTGVLLPKFPILPVLADMQRHPLSPGSVFHIDPARRASGRRLFRYEDLIPGPDAIAALLERYPAGAIKLSPAVDFTSLPPGHLELISERGVVVQAVLWTGTLATDLQKRTATVLTPAGSWSMSAAPNPPPAPELAAAYLYEVDGAVHRAGLAPALASAIGAVPLSLDAGYLTGPEPLDHPALTCFTHVQSLPYKEKLLVEALRAFRGNPGQLDVKTRGGLDLDVDALQRRYGKLCPYALTVLVYRGRAGLTATLATRCKSRT